MKDLRMTPLRLTVVVSTICVLWFGIRWYAHRHQEDQLNLPQITVSDVITKNMPLEIALPGTLQSEQSVIVKSRVDALIKEIHFKEGAIVQKDQPLITLDDDDLQAQLKQAEANLERTKYLKDKADKDLDRQTGLTKKGFVSQSKYDEFLSTSQSLSAEEIALKGAIESLKIRIGYSKITSPLTAIAGFIKQDAGNFIRTQENTPLVSLNQVDPLEVVIQMPEKYLPNIPKGHYEKMEVRLKDIQGNPLEYKAWVDSLDNAVNSSTGTIGVKIKIHNPLVNNRPSIMPGQFVNTTLQVSELKDAIVVPAESVQTSQKGSLIFIYNPETKTVQSRIIKIGHTTLSELVVEEGLKTGEKVVTSGQFRLKDGAKVRVAS